MKDQTTLEKLDNLENEGMIDLMHHQLTRFKAVTWFNRPFQQWQAWIRR